MLPKGTLELADGPTSTILGTTIVSLRFGIRFV